MNLLILLAFALVSFAFVCACATPFDALRAKVEDLGPTLYLRASFREPWLNIIPRDTYPQGSGYARSSFTVGRSEPTLEEEKWAAIKSITDDASGACDVTYNNTTVGHLELTYKPEVLGLVGPLVCQDDLAMYWQSNEFWEKYFQALEKRNRKSIINRIGNVYRQYVPKAAANSGFHFTDGSLSNPVPQNVDLTGLTGSNIPTSELLQEMLDSTAVELQEEGADEPNSNGWITAGADGAVFPLLIGQDASHKLLLNNSELRSDFNNSYQGFADANPVIKRLGASRIIKNFRHIVNRFPARWQVATTGQSIYIAKDSLGNPLIRAAVTIAGATATVVYTDMVAGTTIQTVSQVAANGQTYIRIPTFATVGTTDSANASKGKVAIVNPVWRDPGQAPFESAEVLNPWVMTQEVLKPMNTAPGMKWTPQNYFGEWRFVTGNDALLGFDSCTGASDPVHKLGRHFAEYRCAYKPIMPNFGRMILFRRCSNAFDTVTCT